MMEVISTRRYEARPPQTSAHSQMLIDPENSVALVKEEEWETRKKKEITTTRQIETRVKRQVVLEDGEVVVDSGPLVTTNTTEDVEQQEHTTQERRTTGDDPQEVDWPLGITEGAGGVVQKELNETVVRSREEIEERLETEDRQQLGDITDEAYQRAVRSNRGDLRVALAESSKQLADTTGPRIVQHTTRSSKVVDTEEISEKKEVKPDGLIVTEKKRTVEHEEIKDDEVPDEGTVKDDSSENRKESSERFVKRRDEDVVDYVSGGERVAREMRYVAETVEGERIGHWSPSPTAMRTTRLHKHSGSPGDGTPLSRKDALTKKPLDLEEEDEARKFETSKWLESHFGSESRSSSVDTTESPLPTANTSYINVTMKSCTSPRERERERERERDYQRNYENAGTSNRQQKSRESEYFQGISEWSERHVGKEKQTNHVRTVSPTVYTNGHGEMSKTHEETIRRRDVHHETIQERVRTPSPPVRRRVKEQQWSAKLEERIPANDTPSGRVASPVHVVQRTWENRTRDHQNHREHSKKTSPRSRSTSPKTKTTPKGETKKNEAPPTSRPPKSSSHSKYKIGESFRKLVGKLRSASTERKNKRVPGGSSSTSQLTQTDDNGPTYLQYNVIDRNIPLVSEPDANGENKPPPERPPRSPRNSCLKKPSKTETRSNQEQWQRSGSSTPVHRYYLGEDPFGGSIYGREKGYKDARRPGRSRGSNRIPPDSEYSAPSSLGRFSKSTSRLTNEFDREEQFRSTQTLPRNLHGQHTRQHPTRRQPREVSRHVTLSNQTPPSQAPRYSSMINISIKNAVTSPKIPVHNNVQAPAKPERTYNKSFNVEAERNGLIEYATPKRLPYTSNSQLNRLDETPPLKSPGILASISRNNRDLIKDGRHEY